MIGMLRFTEKSAELIHEIRNMSDMPILFLSGVRTEKTRKEEILRAIKSGADGYLASIQSAEEIVAETIALIPSVAAYQETSGSMDLSGTPDCTGQEAGIP